jgi:hypothetical protein
MRELFGVRNQVEVETARQLVAPMAGPGGVAGDAQKQQGGSGGDAQAGTCLRRGADIQSAPSAVQSVTQSMQPWHSADLMLINRSTGSTEGQVLAHLGQSMDSASTRRMRSGLSKETRP